jgi:ligand-binding SRPBCC domain-containing protein
LGFFSKPDNLKEITPSNLGFNIVSKHHGKTMYAGQIIEYKVKPILGIPLYWMTEISHVEEGKFFVDEQRFTLIVCGIINIILKPLKVVLK